MADMQHLESPSGCMSFGVQQSLDFVQIRLCLNDIGLAGFGSGEMRRKKTTVHLTLPRQVSAMITVHEVVLASKAMRKAYGWRCVLHCSGDFCPRRDPRLVRQPLQPQLHIPAPRSGASLRTRPCMQLSIGTWNVGLNIERKQHEIGSSYVIRACTLWRCRSHMNMLLRLLLSPALNGLAGPVRVSQKGVSDFWSRLH